MSYKAGDAVRIVRMYSNAESNLDGTSAEYMRTDEGRYPERPHLVKLPSGETSWVTDINPTDPTVPNVGDEVRIVKAIKGLPSMYDGKVGILRKFAVPGVDGLHRVEVDGLSVWVKEIELMPQPTADTQQPVSVKISIDDLAVFLSEHRTVNTTFAMKLAQFLMRNGVTLD